MHTNYINKIRSFIFIIAIASLACYAQQRLIYASRTRYTPAQLGEINSFVIRGNTDVSIDGAVSLAVSGLISNGSVKIPVDEAGNYYSSVTMRGPIQDAYIFLGNTLTLPVVPNDTITLNFRDGKFDVSGCTPSRTNDLKLAVHAYDMMRDRLLNINREADPTKPDSVKIELAKEIDNYINDYNKLIADFEEDKGSLSDRNYFINETYYFPLYFANFAGITDKITAQPRIYVVTSPIRHIGVT